MGECEKVLRSTYYGATRHTKRERLMLADEPRRSSRATKGNNSDRWQEVLESARHNFVNADSANDSATETATIDADDPADTQDAAAAEEEEDQIRCVCGQTQEVEDEDKDFVQCDRCSIWQHTQCVGLSPDVSEDQEYFCDECRPDLHKDLLDRIASGKFIKAQPVQKTDKKRKRQNASSSNAKARSTSRTQATQSDDDPVHVESKRQRSSSVSDVSVMSEDSEDPITNVRRPSAVTRTSSTNTTTRTSRTERRNILSQNAKKRGANRKPSASSNFQGPYSDVDDIKDPDRKKIASALVKLIAETIKLAMSNEGFSLSDSVSVDDKAKQLGLEIEFAMFDAQLDARIKFRQLSFNLRDPKNPSLRKRVLDRSLQPAELVQMSSEDMANPELKAKTEALREESLKQSVLVQETGPRIRRTHKGEEYVEGPDAILSEVQATTSADPEHRRSSQSPASVRSPNDSISSTHSPEMPARERSDSNFDINSVWSRLEPTTSQSPALGSRKGSSSVFPDNKNDNDEDLLETLEGGTRDVQDYNYATSGPVWRGKIDLAHQIVVQTMLVPFGGPKSFDVQWDALFTDTIYVPTRNSTERTSNYLRQMRWSTSKTLFALRINPAPGEEQQWKDLYNYLVSKDRYGVIQTHGTRMRDGYLVPVPNGAPIPEYVLTLPVLDLPADQADMLIAVVVVEKEWQEPAKPASPAAEPFAQPQSVPPPTNNRPANVVHGFAPAMHPQWQDSQHPSRHQTPNAPFSRQPAFSPLPPPQEEDPYMRRVQMTNFPPPLAQQQQQPPRLDPGAQEVLGAFLRAHPEVANNPNITSNPQVLGRLLHNFVQNGGMR